MVRAKPKAQDLGRFPTEAKLKPTQAYPTNVRHDLFSPMA
jgi:hypothetical protein